MRLWKKKRKGKRRDIEKEDRTEKHMPTGKVTQNVQFVTSTSVQAVS